MSKSKIDWAAAPLGEAPDAVIANKLGVTRRAVALQRNKRGIASYSSRQQDEE